MLGKRRGLKREETLKKFLLCERGDYLRGRGGGLIKD